LGVRPYQNYKDKSAKGKPCCRRKGEKRNNSYCRRNFSVSRDYESVLGEDEGRSQNGAVTKEKDYLPARTVSNRENSSSIMSEREEPVKNLDIDGNGALEKDCATKQTQGVNSLALGSRGTRGGEVWP